MFSSVIDLVATPFGMSPPVRVVEGVREAWTRILPAGAALLELDCVAVNVSEIRKNLTSARRTLKDEGLTPGTSSALFCIESLCEVSDSHYLSFIKE